MPQSILTGLRANSNLHLGNYLGAILPMIHLQKSLQSEDRLFMFVPNLHSFTTPIDHTKLFENTIENIRVYLACGIDPDLENTIIYRQSEIPAHSELTWILSCFTYFGELQRMTQFKDKAKVQGQTVSVGLFTYPVLMAADILLYKAQYIPLGDDQKQHLEITRDLAIRINNKFEKKIFEPPKPWKDQLEFMNVDEGVRIRSLTNPESKMSKSVEDPKGTILLIDEPKQAAKKVMSAQTDSLGTINWDWKNQPGITNLMQMNALLSKQDLEQVKKTWVGQTSYGNLKKETAGLVETFLTEFQTKLATFTPEMAEKVLEKGEKKANQIAQKTLLEVQKAVGLKR